MEMQSIHLLFKCFTLEQKKEQRNEEESLGNDVKLALVASCLLLLWYRFPRERETSFSLFLQHILPTGEVRFLAQ